MRGRPPKPTAIKKLTGNPGHRPLNDKEPQPLLGAPEMPKGMRFAAKRIWAHVVPQLLTMGVLSVVDGLSLAAYCSAYADWEEAEKHIRKHGLVFEEAQFDLKGEVVGHKFKPNPAVAIKYTAKKAVQAFGARFGLTPADRARLKVEKKPAEDAGEEFMKRAALNSLPATPVYPDLPEM